MERRELNAQTRGNGKTVSKKLRREACVPGVLYGANREPQSIFVDRKEMDNIVSTDAGWNVLLDLTVDGKDKVLARISDYQSDVLKRFLTHIDFQALDINKKIRTEVPVRLVGLAKGVKEGGIMEQIRRSLDIRCLPTNIPGHIDIDVSEMDIGDNIHINDITLPEGVECQHETNFSIASVVAPTVVTAPEVPAEGEEGVEGAEGVAPAEGAAPAEGEKAAAEGAKEGSKKE